MQNGREEDGREEEGRPGLEGEVEEGVDGGEGGSARDARIALVAAIICWCSFAVLTVGVTSTL